MSDQQQQDIERLRPDELVTHFSRTRLSGYLLLAVVLHVLVIGATSVPTIRAYLDPSYEKQTAAAAASSDGEQTPAEAPSGQEGAAEGGASEEGEGGEADSASDAQGEDETASEEGGEGAEQEGQSQVEKRTSEEADPSEIPDQPEDELGISIDDTNPDQ